MSQSECDPICGHGPGLRHQCIFDLDAHIPQVYRIISKTIILAMVQQLLSIPNRKVLAINDAELELAVKQQQIM